MVFKIPVVVYKISGRSIVKIITVGLKILKALEVKLYPPLVCVANREKYSWTLVIPRACLQLVENTSFY